MPDVIDRDGIVVKNCASDAEAVRWWRLEGEIDDRLADTGELLADVERTIGLPWD